MRVLGTVVGVHANTKEEYLPGGRDLLYDLANQFRDIWKCQLNSSFVFRPNLALLHQARCALLHDRLALAWTHPPIPGVLSLYRVFY